MKFQNFICIFLFFPFFLIFSQERSIHLGEEKKWENFSFYNVQKDTGKKGYDDLRLKNCEYDYDKDTELLLHFNHPKEPVPSYYQIKQRGSIDTQNYLLGGAAASFSDVSAPLILIPKEHSFFAPQSKCGDFSLEFWIHPNDLSHRETLFYWKNVRKIEDRLIHQYITCSITNRVVRWDFINFFSPDDFSELSVSVQSRKLLISGEWSHHLVSYKKSQGKLCYSLNGELEDVLFVTDNRKERGVVFAPSVGDNSEGYLYLGKIFYGQIDEFRIMKKFIEKPNLRLFPKERGIALSAPIDLCFTNTQLVQINSWQLVPENSNLFYYYRYTNSRSEKLLWEKDQSENYQSGEIGENWTPFSPSESFSSDLKGQYLQILVEFYAAGNGRISPSLKNIEIVFLEDLPPIPPSGVRALAENGKVTLLWNPVTEIDLAGYEIYYGTESGAYFGEEKALSSPIDVGNKTSYTVENLQNGKLYFFTVVAYDKSYKQMGENDFFSFSDQRIAHKSDFSKEVSARPSRIYQKK